MKRAKLLPNTIAIMSLMTAYFISRELWGLVPAVLLACLVYGVAYFILVVNTNKLYWWLYGVGFLLLLGAGLRYLSSPQAKQKNFTLQGTYQTRGFTPETYLKIFNADSAAMSIAPFQDTIIFTTSFQTDSVRFYQDETERFRWKTYRGPDGVFSLIQGSDSIHFHRILEPVN